MLESFDFDTPAIANQLTGKLATLKRYNALRVPVEFFMEAMDRLREKHLNLPLDAVLHPASRSAQQAARDEQAAAGATPAVQEKELMAQQWFGAPGSARRESSQRGTLLGVSRVARGTGTLT
jgi:hypothetical protein